MRIQFTLLIGVALMGLTSCIKDEPKGREADILQASLSNPGYITSVVSNDKVQLFVSESEDYTKLSPALKITDGATVSPASESVQDFSNGKTVTYTVTAEDGIHSKKYEVEIVSRISLMSDFEEWEEQELSPVIKFPILKDRSWSNANFGVALAKWSDPNLVYPTAFTQESVNGKYAAKLQTVEGVNLAGFIDIALFAGNLFRGEFAPDMENPLRSLHLGFAHPESQGKPILFKGYFKYTPGKVYTDEKRQVVANKTDSMSLYAVLFRVPKGTLASDGFLDGETIFTSDRVVARANVSAANPTTSFFAAKNGYTRFSIPFVYKEDVDFTLYDYRLTIVSSSSKDGDKYRGAVGSTLLVDDLEVICEPVQK